MADTDEVYDGGWKALMTYFRSKGGGTRHFLGSILRHPGYWMLIVTNLAVFFIPGMDLRHQSVTLVWIYLGQSILIGVVHVFKLWFYKFAPHSGNPNDWKSPKAIAVFFCFHYGFFHFIYAMFVPYGKTDKTLLMEGLAIFAAGLILNTIRHFNRENSGRYNANDFMFLPYARILPIHMAIILGSMLAAATGSYLAVFVVLASLKTLMELGLEYAQQLGVSIAELQEKGFLVKK